MLLLPVGLMAGAVLPTRGLVAGWTLQDGAGTTATEFVGGVQGTLAWSAAWTTTDKGVALSLPGSGYVTIPDNAVFAQMLGAVTISGWLRAVSLPSIGTSIIAKTTGALPAPFDFNIAPNGLNFVRGGAGAYQGYGRSFAFNVAAWYHVAVVSPAGNTSATFFVNGVQIGGVTGPAFGNGGNGTASNTGTCLIGSRANGDTQANGALRRVLLRNVVLTAAEVAQEYDYG